MHARTRESQKERVPMQERQRVRHIYFKSALCVRAQQVWAARASESEREQLHFTAALLLRLPVMLLLWRLRRRLRIFYE